MSSEEPSTASEPRSIRRSAARSAANLASSSFTQRAPARSFVQHTSAANTDNAQYSSEGLREQTAKLATWGFSPESLRGDIVPINSDATPRDPHFKLPDALLVDHPEALDRPAVIDEDDEPRSPSPISLAVETTSEGSKTTKMSPGLSQRKSLGNTEANGNSPHERQSEREQYEEWPDETSPLLGQYSERPSDRMITPLKDVIDREGQPTLSVRPNTFQKLLHKLRIRTVCTVRALTHPKRWEARYVWEEAVRTPLSLLPCVFLGVLLNVLDALSYGMILFPLAEPIFANTGADGISMFYVSCIVSQLVFSGGGSIFKGGVGSEMIEVVPFFHKMAYSIMASVGREKPETVLATAITAFAASSILTGIVFFVLGAFKLGSLVSFFPRHILIGCIGGVGFFLFVTGIEVSARLDGNLEYDIPTLRALFHQGTVLLWAIPLSLSIALLLLKSFVRSPYIVPFFFVGIAAIFYVVVAAVPSYDVPGLREHGWIFPAVEAGVPFYNFYSYYQFGAVDWKAFASTIPAMFALTFFGILHLPINVPALAIAAEEDDLNLNRELVAHGISNALSGAVGSIQNYLVYVNSDLFIQNGGNNRLAGFMLAGGTFAVLVAGPDMIGYVPIMVVGALIFYLGIELLQEALYETHAKMNKLEYLTVWAIVLTMGIYDFVGGILVGIVLACLFYVVDTSAKSAIRVTYSGAIVGSTVRRHAVQRHFLHRAGRQIYVTKLAGTLFFGSIVKVEKQSRALIEEEAFRKQPIRFLIFDLAHVNGLDYSAAEAFTRLQRVLRRREVRMIMSGVEKDSDVGKSLCNVGLWQDDNEVGFFETLNLALESCENQLLAAFYRQSSKLVDMSMAARSQDSNAGRPRQLSTFKPTFHLNPQNALDIPAQPAPDYEAETPPLGISVASPRTKYLAQATTATLDAQRESLPHKRWSTFKQPLPLLLHTMQGLSRKNEDFWFKAMEYFTSQELGAGDILYHINDKADAFYLLEKGILRATCELPMGGYQESIVAGTTCGELPFFSDTRRTATVVAEYDHADKNDASDAVVVWALHSDAWARLQAEWPEGAQELLSIALRLTKERVDAVTGYVLTTAG